MSPPQSGELNPADRLNKRHTDLLRERLTAVQVKVAIDHKGIPQVAPFPKMVGLSNCLQEQGNTHGRLELTSSAKAPLGR